ncbi:MAG: class I tRNA ligase family protein [Acidobacteria bacterium]|nr:class I tRNA ligase family protein [Acidobacteriota bacterium]
MSTVVTSAFPFVPATISLANMASTYVPADSYTRLLRLFGRDAVHVTGIDVHSQFVSTDGKTRDGSEAFCSQKCLEYQRAFESLNIQFDAIARTDETHHTEAVREALQVLLAHGAITQRQISVVRCDGCGAFPAPRLTESFDFARLGLEGDGHAGAEPRCPYCRAHQFSDVLSTHYFLVLEPYRNKLLAECERVVRVEAARPLIRSWLAEPLADWNISRDNSIGISLEPQLPGKSLYLWFESLIGYWSMARLAAANPKKFVHFFGQNILYYHAVVWPVLYGLCYGGGASDILAAVRGLVDKQRSDPELLDIDQAVRSYPPDYLRFYLVWSGTDGLTDVRLTRATLVDVVNGILCDSAGNLLRRLAVLLQKRARAGVQLSSEDELVQTFYKVLIPALLQAMDEALVGKCLRLILDYVSQLNRMMAAERLYEAESAAVNGRIAFMLATVLTLLSPFVPRLVEEYNIFVGWSPRSLADIMRAAECPLRQEVGLWKKLT